MAIKLLGLAIMRASSLRAIVETSEAYRVEAADADRLASELNTLQVDFDMLSNSHATLAIRNKDLTTLVSDVESSMRVTRDRYDDAQRKLTTVRDECERLNLSLAEYKASYEAACSEVTTLQKRLDFTAQPQDNTTALTSLASMVNRLNAEMLTNFDHVNSTNNQILSAVSTPSPVQRPAPIQLKDTVYPNTRAGQSSGVKYREPADRAEVEESINTNMNMSADQLLAAGVQPFTPEAVTGLPDDGVYTPLTLPSQTMIVRQDDN